MFDNMGKGKGKDNSKPNTYVLKSIGCVHKDDTCFQCGEADHWKRNF